MLMLLLQLGNYVLGQGKGGGNESKTLGLIQEIFKGDEFAQSL